MGEEEEEEEEEEVPQQPPSTPHRAPRGTGGCVSSRTLATTHAASHLALLVAPLVLFVLVLRVQQGAQGATGGFVLCCAL